MLHHPQEAQGIDFWWIDWQQGETHQNGRARPAVVAEPPALSTTWAGTASAARSSSRAGAGWATTATRSVSRATRSPAGLRWPSSPTSPPRPPTWPIAGGATTSAGTWAAFATASCTPAGCSSASSARSCACTPPRTPTTTAARGPTMPRCCNVARAALQLRHALIPYLYSMAWRNHLDARPLVLPMYYTHPEDEAAYRAPEPVLVRQRADRRAVHHPARPGYPPDLAGRLAAGRRLVRLLQRRAPARRALAHLLRHPGRDPGGRPGRRDRAAGCPNPAGAASPTQPRWRCTSSPARTMPLSCTRTTARAKPTARGTPAARCWPSAGRATAWSSALPRPRARPRLAPARRTYRLALHGICPPGPGAAAGQWGGSSRSRGNTARLTEELRLDGIEPHPGRPAGVAYSRKRRLAARPPRPPRRQGAQAAVELPGERRQHLPGARQPPGRAAGGHAAAGALRQPPEGRPPRRPAHDARGRFNKETIPPMNTTKIIR